MMPIGWPIDHFGPMSRKPLSEVVHANRWGNAWSMPIHASRRGSGRHAAGAENSGSDQRKPLRNVSLDAPRGSARGCCGECQFHLLAPFAVRESDQFTIRVSVRYIVLYGR
jgi:hypothetical protein